MRVHHYLFPLLALAGPLAAQATPPVPGFQQGDSVEVLLPQRGSGWLGATIHFVGQCPTVLLAQDPANRYVGGKPKEIRTYSLLALKGLRLRSPDVDSTWVTLGEEDLWRYGACSDS